MQLSPLTIERLRTYIIGDADFFPRLTGPEILTLFHLASFKDVYDFKNGGMPGALSRKEYAAEKLKEINGRKEIQKIVEAVVSKAHFLKIPEMRSQAIEALNAILSVDNYRLVDTGEGEFKIEGAADDEVAIIEAHFEENRELIIAEIKKARFLIWVAVAWLTDTGLLTELRLKKEQGLNIQIVTQDDQINADLKPFVERTFEAYYKKPHGVYKNLMHHKFCIIDLRTVVHGSYNWTIKAQYNKETVTVNHQMEFAAQFATTFMALKRA